MLHYKEAARLGGGGGAGDDVDDDVDDDDDGGTSPKYIGKEKERKRWRVRWWRIWALQGRRAPPLGINYLVDSPRERERDRGRELAHPGYYCLIDGQTNGSRPPSNNVVIKLSAGADKSTTDPAGGSSRATG